MKKCILLSLLLLLVLTLPFAAKAEAVPTAEEAADYVREQLEHRNTTCTAEFAVDAPMDAPYTYLLQLALAHTGVPTQGDYLRWHLNNCNLSYDTRQEADKTVYTITYKMTYYASAQEEELLNQAVTELLSQLALDEKSDYHKALAIYRYICDNVVYDQTASFFSAYDALVKGTSVCQGYATLFYRLALEAGLDCRVIPGTAGGNRHGWNIVKIRDRYYNLDATWDAGNETFQYFLKGAQFYFHSRDNEFSTEDFLAAYPAGDGPYLPKSDCSEDHSFTRYTQKKAPTCKEAGCEIATCDICEVTDLRQLPTTEHLYETYFPNNDATMLEDGTKTALCTYCGHPDTQPDPGSRLPKTGWLLENGQWYYYHQDQPYSGWLQYGKVWYYLKPSGEMATGWLKIGNTWYYLKPSGEMATGWLKEGNTWYYLKSSGAMATGWLKEGSTWYYLKSSGAMATGWLQTGKEWYYLKSSGAMLTGWLQYGGAWYYLKPSGAMATGNLQVNGIPFIFSGSGVCLNP